MRRLGELAVERVAGAGRAGEEQAVDAGMGGERLAGLGPALDAADDALGHARLVIELDQIFADRRRLLARLEHDRIAGDQRRDDVAVGQMRREIIGAEHREHAVRLVADGDAGAERAFEPPLRGAVGISRDRNVDLVDDRLDLGARFPERLAGLARDQVGEGARSCRARHWRIAAGSRRGRRGTARPSRPRRRGRPRPRRRGLALLARPERLAGGGFDRGQAGHAAHSWRDSRIFQAFARDRLAHPADGGDLGVERRPIVSLVDRRPDRLDLLDRHRAGLGSDQYSWSSAPGAGS